MGGRRRALNVALAAVAAGGLGLGINAVGAPQAPRSTPRLVSVSPGVVQSTVSATGNVQAPGSLAVNFKTAGLLTSVMVSPGQKVTKGQTLASIDDTDLRTTLANAQSSLATAQARLTQTTMGLTPQEQLQNQIAADQAQAAVEFANLSLQNTQNMLSLNANGYQATVDQARAQLARDQTGLSNDQAQLDQDTNQLAADQAQLAADQSLLAADQAAGAAASKIQSDQQAVSSSQSKATQSQSKVQSSQAKVNADNNTIAKDNEQIQNALNAQIVGLARDRQTLDGSVNSLNSAIRSQQSTLAANAVKTQPVKPGDLAAAQATVQTAQAAVDTAQRAVDATTLVAPIAGTVATVSGKVGETISATGSTSGSGGTGAAAATTSGFITIADLASLVVKAGFSETDAAKIQVDQAATISLDALPTARLTGKVAAVDTTATVVSNVVTYNVTVALDNPTAEVKPGMTATTVVVVSSRQNVLNVPSAAVTGQGANGQVIVMENGKQTSIPVAVGLRGDSSTEILSGLTSGQEVVVSQGTGLATTGRTGTGGPGTGGANTGGRVGAGGGVVGGGGGPVVGGGGGR